MRYALLAGIGYLLGVLLVLSFLSCTPATHKPSRHDFGERFIPEYPHGSGE
jgi:hypothetical protein